MGPRQKDTNFSNESARDKARSFCAIVIWISLCHVISFVCHNTFWMWYERVDDKRKRIHVDIFVIKRRKYKHSPNRFEISELSAKTQALD